jgi:hypothetical protein
MRFFTSIAATAMAVFPIAIASTCKPHKPYDMDPNHYKPDHLIKTDVVVVGGGAAGTYAAIQLKDQHKKVVVIESKARLGGHTETYHDPESGQPIDMGVLLYHDEPIVHEWYARFNLSLSRINFGGAAPQYVDFRTGKIEKTYRLPTKKPWRQLCSATPRCFRSIPTSIRVTSSPILLQRIYT